MSAAEHDLGDHARGDRGQHVIAAYANPVIAARRLTQAVTAVIVDHILTVAIIIRQPVSTTPFARAFAVHTGTAACRAIVSARRRRTIIVVMLVARNALRTMVLRLILVLIIVAVILRALRRLHALLRLTARTLLRGAVIIVTAGAARCALRKGRRCQAQT